MSRPDQAEFERRLADAFAMPLPEAAERDFAAAALETAERRDRRGRWVVFLAGLVGAMVAGAVARALWPAAALPDSGALVETLERLARLAGAALQGWGAVALALAVITAIGLGGAVRRS